MTSTDPRRLGFGAVGLCRAYAAALFLPGTVAPLVIGPSAAVVAITLALWMPLPQWRESEDRKRVAGWVMTGEAVAIAAIMTIVRTLVG